MIPKVRASAVIQATTESVWALVRDFNGLPNWHPAVIESVIEDCGAGTQVGSVRRYLRTDGLILRERLTAHDDLKPSVTYVLLDEPLPVRNYISRLRFLPITELNWTFGEWIAWYDVAPADEAQVGKAIEEVFRDGLDSLKRILQQDEQP